MANKLIKNIAEKGLNYAKPRNQEEKSIQSQKPIARVSLDGKITKINNTKQPIAKVGLDEKITAINRKEKKKKSGFFQGSKYFDNGYDFGDISKTLFWSGADLLQDVTRGFSRTIEGTTDTLGYLSADVLDFFGADDTADWLRDVSKYDVTGKLLKPSDYLEQRSVFGNYSDTVFEGVGNVGAMVLTNAAMPGSGATSTMLTSFSSAYGNSMSEALRNGADLNTARKTAIIHGTAEAISEQFFSGLPGLKTENWGGKAVGKFGNLVEKYFGTNTGKVAMKILNTSGEGFEEIISNMLVSVGNDVMHKIDKDFTYGMEGQTGNIGKDLLKSMTSKESWEQFLSASLTSALTNGGNQFISNNQKNKLIKSYAQENNMTVSQVKQAFNQSVQEKTQYQIQQQPKMNLGQRVETENQAKAKTMSELKRGTFVQPGTETDAYQYQETDNEKVNNARKSLAELNVNNTIQTREMAKTAERLARDLGIDVEFTNNEKLQSQMSEEQKKETQGRVVNGFVDKNTGKMYLNVDSNELANFTIGHETKHFFEANEELNNVLNKALKEYAQLKGRYDEDLARVTKIYTDKNGNLITDPETELMADYVGEFFTDYNFVSNLSTKNPSLFEKVRSFFQNLYYKATGQKEKLLIKQINDNLNKAYREYSKGKIDQSAEKGGTQFLLSYANTAKLSEKQSTRLNEAIKMKDNNSTSEEIWNKTGVMFDEGKAKLYVDDLKLKNDVEKLIKTNKQIKLSELFDSKVFENYPELKDYYFEVRNFEQDAIDEGLSQEQIEKYKKVKGTTTEDNGVIVNSNLKSINEMENVLSHEVQHLIQEINGDKTDSNKVLEEQGKKAYRTLPSEVEAEVNRVLNIMTSEQRKNIDPQSIRDEILKYYEETGYEKSVNVDKIINRLVNKHGIQYSLSVKDANPTEDSDIRYSLSQKEDTYLDELSEQQMEYFKDTKAVDKQGYLDVVFHGTPKDFTVFDISQADNVALGNGLYFTTSEGNAESYSKGTDGTEGKVLEGYVNIVNPASRTEKTLTFDNFKKLYNELNNNTEMYDEEMGMSNIDALLSDYGNVYEENIDNILRKFYDSYDNDVSLIDNLSYMDNAKEMYKTLRDVTGLDGIIAENPTGFDDKETYYIIFNPDQFKLKSNKTPTINEDMRYSISQEGEDLESYYQDLYPIKSKVTTRLSDLKRKEVELPAEQENTLKRAENEQKQGEKPTRREVIDKNRQLARELLGDITQIKDKKRGLSYQINTMKRNLRDIMNKEQAQNMYDTIWKPITENNAKIENEITSYNEKIQKYNINDKESTYIQMLGELRHNPETTLTKQQVDDFYNKNSNKIDQQKCEKAIPEFRQIYDELIERVNDVLTDNGYKPIEYRKGYFPHFIEEKATSKLGKLAEKLGWRVKKGQLPTDIAGITDQFKPGKAWTSFSQQRTGDATDYNALKGLDNYLRGAMDVIYHTNDIQKLRALENEIRYQYSSKGVQDKINEIYADENLDMEEKNDAIANLTSNIRESGLGNFVTEIRNYTDNLANKKAFGDRSMEQTLGRDVYSIMNNINGRVSANMVGANISSAITNFIPITQAWSQLSTKNLMRGMYESIKTSIKGDNFADRSTFLTNRTKQAERLYNTKMDKLTQKLGVPFEAIDSFTSNTIVRAKYYDNIAKGMSEQEAMSNADEFAKDIMAGRSKGDQPTIFNRKNPLFKLFTAFQLEVNNQYGYMFKDIPTNMADEAKRKLVGAFIKMFLGAWLYNEITEKFTGRRAAFDPIDMAISDVKTLTNEDMDLGDKIQSIVKDTAQEVPFVSGLAGGGRLPIQGAIPYSNPLEMVTKTFEDIGKLDDPEKRKTAINNLKKEWSKPVYYLLFPVAGGQVKKTVEGLSMYDKDLPIAGSYTNSGKLRFEADTSTLGKIQSAVFGQYASKNAREYFKNGYTPLTEGQVEEALEAELPINEYREINQGIKDAKAEAKAKGENQTEAMYDYIYDLPIEMEQKNSLINSRTKGSTTIKDDNGYIKYVDDKGKTYWYDKKNDVVYNSKYKEMNTKDIADLTKASTQKDISNYGNYGSLAEFNYSNKNPEKYLALTKIADYDTFMEYKDELAAIKQRYDNKPTEFKKKKVFEYINSLPLSVEQKLMLQKMGAGYSIKQYRGRLHNYINNMELTKEQKQAIDKVLFD